MDKKYETLYKGLFCLLSYKHDNMTNIQDISVSNLNLPEIIHRNQSVIHVIVKLLFLLFVNRD